jgi:hypothetical protein
MSQFGRQAPIGRGGTVGRGGRRFRLTGFRCRGDGFHGSPEGVLLQGDSSDSFVDVAQFADGEARAEDALGVGAVAIPSPKLGGGGFHDVGVVVRQWPRPGDGGQPEAVRVSEQRAGQCVIRDDGKVGHGQHPSAYVAVWVVEDGELGWVATGDAGLQGEGSGQGRVKRC